MSQSRIVLNNMVERRDLEIKYLKKENNQLRHIIIDLEKKNAYLKALVERR